MQSRAKPHHFLPFLFLASALLLLQSGCQLNPEPPELYALVYGISDYSTNPLTYTDDDARSIAQKLNEKGYTVHLRLNNGVGSYPYAASFEAATKTQLYTDFSLIVPQIDEDDILLIYFSGHGGQYSGTDPDEDQFADSSGEALLFYPGTAGSDLSDNDFYRLLSGSDIVKKVVIIDACNSGGFIGREYDFDALHPAYSDEDDQLDGIMSSSLDAFFSSGSADIRPSNAIVLSAAGEREVSWETGSYGHGVFTYALLNAFENADYNGDDFIDTGEVYKYACDFIDTYWNNAVPDDEEFQFMPHISGGAVDYLLFEAD